MGCDTNYLWIVVESVHYRGGMVVMITRKKEIELDDLYKFANSCSHTFLDRVVGKEMSCKIVNELIQYKTIEKELGIDLITLFKALKNGFYTKTARYTGYGMGVSIEKKCLWREEWQDDIYYFKDYSKTWALTKEELL